MTRMFVQPSLRLGKQSGHTLVEVLVALTVTMVIVSFLFGALQWSGRAWKTAERTEEYARVDAVHILLRRSIEGARAKFELDEFGDRVLTFNSDGSLLTFIGPAPAKIEIPGLYQIQISVEHEGIENSLVLRRVLYMPKLDNQTTDTLEHTDPYMLIRSIEGVKFSYFGVTKDEDEPYWHDEWSAEATALPQLVRIDIEFPEGDPRVWPSLIVAPKIDG